MSDPILHFLIVFNHTTSELLEVNEFGVDIQAALLAYAQNEREHSGDEFIEIVLVGSDSLDSVKATHTNYFSDKLVSSEWLSAL